MGPKQRAALIALLESVEQSAQRMKDAARAARDMRDMAYADLAMEASYEFADIALPLRTILFGADGHRQKVTEELVAMLTAGERVQIEIEANERLKAEIARRFGAPVTIGRRAMEI